MKQPFYYLSIATASLLFLGCTPTVQSPTPQTPKKTTSKKSPLEEALDHVQKTPKKTKKKRPKAPKKSPSTPTYIDPSETKKEIEEISEPTTPLPEATSTTMESSKTPIEAPNDPYGEAPKNYRDTIRAYLNKRADSGESIKYIFSRPKKAQKRRGSWKGWMVQVDVLKRDGHGAVIRKQPYTILFEDSEIVDDIAEENAKSVKVVY